MSYKYDPGFIHSDSFDQWLALFFLKNERAVQVHGHCFLHLSL